MTKTPNLSVLVLALALTILSGGVLSASTIATNRATRSAQLEQAVTRAKQAQTLAENIQSTTYAGLDAYLARLLREAEADYIVDEDALVAALNEAATSTELLLGVNRQNQNTNSQSASSDRQNTSSDYQSQNTNANNVNTNSQNQDNVSSQNQNNGVKAQNNTSSQNSSTQSQNQPNQSASYSATGNLMRESASQAVAQTQANQTGSSQSNDVETAQANLAATTPAELPNTGETKLNIMGFVLAGITAATSALVVTAVILRSRRHDQN